MSTDQGTQAGTAPYSQSIDGCLEGAIGKYGIDAEKPVPWKV